MTLQTSFGKVFLTFTHLKTKTGERCTIARLKSPIHDGSFWGLAVCSKKDRFCKETGRKVAIGKALHSWSTQMDAINLKQYRQEIWKAYFLRNFR